MGESQLFGETEASAISPQIAGYMRFDAEDESHLEKLLARHPIVIPAGTVELCSLPISS